MTLYYTVYYIYIMITTKHMEKLMEPTTVKCDIIGVTKASLKVRLNNHTVLLPAHQIKGVEHGKVTFHHRKDALHFYKITA